MASCVEHVLKSLERVVGREDATKKDQVQEFFHKKDLVSPWPNGSMCSKKQVGT